MQIIAIQTNEYSSKKIYCDLSVQKLFGVHTAYFRYIMSLMTETNKQWKMLDNIVHSELIYVLCLIHVTPVLLSG